MTDDKTLEAVAKALFLRCMPSEVWPEFAGSLLRKSYMDDARAALEAAEACGYVRVPEGFVVVPREATGEMYDGFRSVNCTNGTDGMEEFAFFKGDLGNWRACYDAMIAAAPAPPKGDVA